MIKFELKKHRHIYDQPQFGEDWFTYPDLYRDMVKEFPSGSIFVEVGSWKGKSSAFMAVEIANSKKNIQFFCVDTWEGSVEHKENPELSQLYEIFLDNMKPVKQFYRPVRLPSLEAVNGFEDNSLDFVFIDASHEYEDVVQDLKAWYPKVKPGGVLAGHDYYPANPEWCGVLRAVNEVFPDSHIQIPGNCFMVSK
jgi:SAM-dependent methyltransferase